MNKELSALLNCAADKEVQKDIEALMSKAGIYCRVFTRIKKVDSLEHKLKSKQEVYSKENRKLQDLIGVRIVLYFEDDRDVCQRIIGDQYDIDWKDSQIDDLETTNFRAVRYNLICKMPDKIISMFDKRIWESYPIDKTIEVQIRTIFSEGWHEVEHDIRYKHLKIWETNEYKEFGRFLNSIFATLEMCDASIIHLMERMAYNAYTKGAVEEMIRYKFRIHFSDDVISKDLKDILKDKRELLKSLFRLEREDVLKALSSPELEIIPKTMDNMIYLCNEIWIKDENIHSLASPNLISRVEKMNGLDIGN